MEDVAMIVVSGGEFLARTSARRSSVGTRSRRAGSERLLPVLARALILTSMVAAWPTPVRAERIDIPCAGGCVAFGSHVAVLSNGNIVVVDDSGPISNI